MEVNFNTILEGFEPITLEEMSSIRLMNRIDSKFLCNTDTLVKLLDMARADYRVQEIAGKRIGEYGTLYLDDAADTMYTIHHNGRLTRQKVRIRSYLDSRLYFFEVKLKNNHGRTKKKRIEVSGTDDYKRDDTRDFLAKHTILPFGLDDLKPKIRNHFNRMTLVNRDCTERLTIDIDLQFQNLESGISRSMGSLVILELKRDGNTFSPVLDMFRCLRIHPSGFSKYCIGMALTAPGIKTNNFKKKIRKIDKITSL